VVVATHQEKAFARVSDESLIKTGQYLAANHAFIDGDYERAAQYYTSIPNLLDRQDIVFKTYWSFVLAGRVDEAKTYVERYYDYQPLSSSARILLSLYAYKDNDLKKAATYLLDTNIKKLHEDLSSIDRIIFPYLQIWAHVGVGDIAKAKKYISTLERKGKHPQHFIQLQRALLHEIAGETEKAKKLYDVLQQTAILPFNFIKVIGNFYLRNNEVERAKQLYLRYELLNPHMRYFSETINSLKDKGEKVQPVVASVQDAIAEIYKESARVLAKNDYINEATVYAYMALHLLPENSEASFYLGEYLADSGDTQRSIAAYRAVKKNSYFYYRAQGRLMRALFESGKKTQAMKVYQSLQRQYPKDYQLHALLADLYRADRRFAIARIYYTKAIKIIESQGKPKSEHWGTYFGRGMTYEQLKQWKSAEVDLKLALQLNPGQPDVLNYLGYGWLERETNLDKAKGMIEKAMSQRPNDAYIIDSMAWTYYKLGDYKTAVTYLEKAVGIIPYDSVLNDHLGDVYWKLGRTDEARFQWNRALNYNVREQDVDSIKRKIKFGLPDVIAQRSNH
jgi:tetratricopeptide (TPR) repeat protein